MTWLCLCCCCTTAPSCREVVVSVDGSGATGFLIEFTPNEPGAYEVIVEYGGQCLPCSPLLMAAYDINRVRVMGVRDSMTGCPGTFVGMFHFSTLKVF